MKTIGRRDVAFTAPTMLLILLAHALAYLIHEYAHSFTAWALGYMPNPLALDYGGASPANLIFLAEVGDNVHYDPIVGGGHGFAAAAIALAGPFVGNGLLYILLCAAAARSKPSDTVGSAFLFWLLLMCAGNVWSYVPIRAITTHADIAIAARGLGLNVWALFPLLLAPSLLLIGHFLTRACPRFIPAMTGGAPALTAVVIGLVAAWCFMLFGGIGFSGSYGPVAQSFSIVSEMVLMPFAVLWLWRLCQAGEAA